MDRFGIEEVYGMHNMPGMAVGDFATRPGPMLAATDEFTITISGRRRPRGAAARHRRSDHHRHGARPGAADDRLALGRPGRRGGGLRHPLPRRRRLQRHRRDRPRSPARSAPSSPRFAISSRRGCARSWQASPPPTARGSTLDYDRNYPVTRNHPRQIEFAADGRRGDRRRRARRHRRAAADGRRGLLLHARSSGRAPSSSSATATPPASTIRPTISTTRRSAIGCSYWVRLVERAMPA